MPSTKTTDCRVHTGLYKLPFFSPVFLLLLFNTNISQSANRECLFGYEKAPFWFSLEVNTVGHTLLKLKAFPARLEIIFNASEICKQKYFYIRKEQKVDNCLPKPYSKK